MPSPKLSIVIPVFNAAGSLHHVVERIRKTFVDDAFELILVNDGSHDRSEQVILDLMASASFSVKYVHLAKNFGEHHAVLAGIARTEGEFVATLDDDGQNPPEELPRMLDALCTQRLDVIFGRYVQRKHSWFRRLGSWFNDRVATWMLQKPPGLYLSSFKVMNRFVANEVVTYQGPFPYLDGLICRTTDRLGQIEVQHEARFQGHSGYTLKKLVRLWLNMFLGFSIMP